MCEDFRNGVAPDPRAAGLHGNDSLERCSIAPSIRGYKLPKVRQHLMVHSK